MIQVEFEGCLDICGDPSGSCKKGHRGRNDPDRVKYIF